MMVSLESGHLILDALDYVDVVQEKEALIKRLQTIQDYLTSFESQVPTSKPSKFLIV